MKGVGDEFHITMGQSPPGSTYNEKGEGMPFYQGRRDFGFRFPTKRVYCVAPKRLAEPGDTLVSVRAPVGDATMASEACCVGRGVAAVRHKSGSRSYTYYTMVSLQPEFARYEGEGTVFACINKKPFAGITHVVPPAQAITRFETSSAPLDSAIDLHAKQTRDLSLTRDALLPRLLSGAINPA